MSKHMYVYISNCCKVISMYIYAKGEYVLANRVVPYKMSALKLSLYIYSCVHTKLGNVFHGKL